MPLATGNIEVEKRPGYRLLTLVLNEYPPPAEHGPREMIHHDPESETIKSGIYRSATSKIEPAVREALARSWELRNYIKVRDELQALEQEQARAQAALDEQEAKRRRITLSPEKAEGSLAAALEAIDGEIAAARAKLEEVEASVEVLTPVARRHKGACERIIQQARQKAVEAAKDEIYAAHNQAWDEFLEKAGPLLLRLVGSSVAVEELRWRRNTFMPGVPFNLCDTLQPSGEPIGPEPEVEPSLPTPARDIDDDLLLDDVPRHAPARDDSWQRAGTGGIGLHRRDDQQGGIIQSERTISESEIEPPQPVPAGEIKSLATLVSTGGIKELKSQPGSEPLDAPDPTEGRGSGKRGRK